MGITFFCEVARKKGVVNHGTFKFKEEVDHESNPRASACDVNSGIGYPDTSSRK
jgi:hypothetical protein